MENSKGGFKYFFLLFYFILSNKYYWKAKKKKKKSCLKGLDQTMRKSPRDFLSKEEN